MIILSTAGGSKTIKIIPRDMVLNDDGYLMIIKRDGDKATDRISALQMTDMVNYIEIEFTSQILTEDSTYSLEIINDGDKLWYRDKIYVTPRNQEQIETTKHVIGNNTIYKSYDVTDDNTYII